MMRRVAFSVVTVHLFDHPQMQMIAHHTLTLATMLHLVAGDYVYESRRQKFVEVSSELLLHLMSIGLSYFNTLHHTDLETSSRIECFVLSSLVLLFLVNFAEMFWAIIDSCRESKQRKKLL